MRSGVEVFKQNSRTMGQTLRRAVNQFLQCRGHIMACAVAAILPIIMAAILFCPTAAILADRPQPSAVSMSTNHLLYNLPTRIARPSLSTHYPWPKHQGMAMVPQDASALGAIHLAAILPGHWPCCEVVTWCPAGGPSVDDRPLIYSCYHLLEGISLCAHSPHKSHWEP